MGKSSLLRPHEATWPAVRKGPGIALDLDLVGAFAGLTCMGATHSGELVFAEEGVDVGQLALGQQVVHRFSMRKSGTEPVTIKKEVASVLEGC